MGHLAATEDNHNLDTVAVFKEAFDFADFNVKVVIRDFEANFHLFELGLFFAGFFAVFSFFLHLLILVFTPVNNLDDRRIGVGRNLDEIDTLVSGKDLGVSATHDAELLTTGSNYANFFITDFSVYTSVRILVTYGGSFLLDLNGFIISKTRGFFKGNLTEIEGLGQMRLLDI